MAVPLTGTKIPRSGRIHRGRMISALLAVSVVVLVLAGWWISRLFVGSPDFGLRALEVRGLRLLRGQDILAASGLRQGDNIFAIELEEVNARLEQLPWVKQALIVRKPPDRLVVTIAERQRLAWIDLGKIYGIDREGVLLPGRREEVETFADLDLPVISGMRSVPDSLRLGVAVADSVVARILDWWEQASACDAEFCMNVSEIQPLEDASIRLLLVGDGLEVRLPIDRVPERLGVLKTLMRRVYRECPEPAYIDLRFAGQVVVGSKTAVRSS